MCTPPDDPCPPVRDQPSPRPDQPTADGTATRRDDGVIAVLLAVAVTWCVLVAGVLTLFHVATKTPTPRPSGAATVHTGEARPGGGTRKDHLRVA